jgi:CubicO group peptidase (beta-lactamase class C family)
MNLRKFFSRRNLLRLAGWLVGLVALILIAWVIVAGPVTVGRVMRYGDTQIDDFEYYPARQLTASDAPFLFADETGAGRVPAEIALGEGAPQPLEDLLAGNDTIAFLVIKDDVILLESYYQDHGPNSLSQVFSVSKSVTATLVGVAIRDGIFASTSERVTDYAPELAASGWDGVTIRDLLTMTSGSDYLENDNPFGIHVILNYTPVLEAKILGFGMQDEPGSVFRYKSGDNAVLALMLSRALAPRTIADYTQEALWAPLGMQHDGLWSLDDEGGLEKTWCCLAASAHDLAKIGRLYLQNGVWEGAQILPPEWAREATTAAIPHESWPEDLRAAELENYGYFWWLLSGDDGEALALGKDGQYIYLNPAANAIIVRLGWSQGELFTSEWVALFRAIAGEIR